MNSITLVSLAVIAALVGYINRERIDQWYCRKIGAFTVFRAVYPDGRSAEYFAFSDADKARLYHELNDSRDTGRSFSAAGAIASYEVIDGRTYNQLSNSN